MPPWPWPGYLIFFLLPGGQRWWPTEAQAWWVRQQLGDFMQRFAHLLCSLARNVFPRKPITIPLQNGKKIHWNMWKSGKIRKTKVQHLSKSALQSFVAPLFIPYFCWRLGHQLLPPRAAVAGWRVGWARWNHQPRHAHAAFAFGAQVLHSWW